MTDDDSRPSTHAPVPGGAFDEPLTRWRVRSEEDLLALVPFCLGFHPEQSLVLICLDGRGHPFAARIDLPPTPDLAAEVVAEVVAPVLTHRTTQLFVALYTGDRERARVTWRALRRVLREAALEPLAVLRADGRRWFPLGSGSRRLREEGVPYDLRSHELTSRSVLEGRVTYGSREELAASLQPAAGAEEVRRAHAALPPLDTRLDGLRAEGEWLRALLCRHERHEGTGDAPADPLTPLVVARLVRAVADPRLRDLVWCGLDRSRAAAHLHLWRVVVARCPDDLAAPAASVLAFVAWLSGDGALSRCAAERSLALDPRNILAELVVEALDRALPPSSWDPLVPPISG